jgi:putative membrane protein
MKVQSYFITKSNKGGIFLKIFSELALLMKGKGGFLVPLLAAIAIPLIYAFIYLSNALEPPETLPELPVAVVNLDKGADNDGEKLTVGDDLVEELKKGKLLGWEFVSEEEADKGLKDNRYYLVIKIPEDFSQKATTVMDADPQKLGLEYIQNEGKNMRIAEVTDGAVETIREKLATKVTTKYVNNVFASLSDVAEGFQTAADGAGKIHDGSTQLHDGSTLLYTTLTEKSPDIQKLADGTKELAAGTNEMYSNLKGKQASISELAAGTKTLNDGTTQLLGGLKGNLPKVQELAAGTKSLEQKVPVLKAGTAELLGGLNQLKLQTEGFKANVQEKLYTNGILALEAEVDGNNTAEKPGLVKSVQALSSNATNLKVLLGSLEQLTTDSESGLTDSQKTALTNAIALSKGIDGGLQSLSGKAPELAAGIDGLVVGIRGAGTPENPGVLGGLQGIINGLDQKLIPGQTQIDAGVGELVVGSKLLSAGGTTIEAGWGSLITNVGTLDAGAKKIKDGNQTVDAGWKQLTAGANKINSGMVQVNDGTQTVNTGWGDLTAGVQQLDTGLAQLNSGANELATGLKDGAAETSAVKTADANTDMFVSPVELVGSKVNAYSEYRDSSAPYYLSLALFVGLLIMTLFVDLKNSTTGVGPTSFASRLTTLAVIAIAQALVVSLSTLLFLGLDVASSFAYILLMIVTSLAFLMVILALISVAGHVGRFIAFVLIILQLIISGGDAPIEALPGYLQALSKFMPMTYSVSGFKSLISLGDTGSAWGSLLVLLVFLAVGFVIIFAWNLFRSKNIDQPNIITE